MWNVRERKEEVNYFLEKLIVFFIWKVWEDFEKNHGNIDTYKEYMRIKRSVLQRFSILPPDVKRIKEMVANGEL